MKLDPPSMEWIERYNLLTSAVVPKPIALVSTVGEDGVFNVAPYAFYGLVAVTPPVVYIAIGDKRRARQKKDTVKNIQFTKDFVINAVDEALAEPMNQSSADFPSDIDEFKEVGLTAVKSDLVKAPRVAESPVNLECRVLQFLEFGEFPESSTVIMGEVVRAHIKDDLWTGKAIDISKFKVIGSVSKETYCRTRDTFVMERPGTPDTK